MQAQTFSPREIVGELDRFIVGQGDAKRAVAIALRNRWRRAQLPDGMRDEVVPKNILMIGPTGCGKTEIARRLAKLAQAPFLKVEATKFTEVGYVGRDVDSIVRDLVEVSLNMLRESGRRDVQARAEGAAEERLVEALVGATAGADTKSKFRKMLRDGQMEDKDVEISVPDNGQSAIGQIDLPGVPPGQVINLGEMMRGMMGGRTVQKKMRVDAARPLLQREEADKLVDAERLAQDAVRHAEDNGIVFLDEIDKVCARTSEGGFRGGRRLPRGRAARPAAADRGHHRLHQIRAGEDRPHPVHRLRRVPLGQARRPAAGAAGAPADPRRTGAAVARRSAPHPDRARAQPSGAVFRIDADRRGSHWNSAKTRSTRLPISRRTSTTGWRISARAGSRRCWKSCWKKFPSPPRTATARRSTSMHPR